MPDRSLLVTLAVFLGQCLIFSGAGVAAQIWRRRLTGRGSTALEAILLGALAPCALGYLAFALSFTHPLLGRAFSWLTIAGLLGTLAHSYLLPPSVQRSTFARLRLSLSPSPPLPLCLSPSPPLPLSPSSLPPPRAHRARRRILYFRTLCFSPRQVRRYRRPALPAEYARG